MTPTLIAKAALFKRNAKDDGSSQAVRKEPPWEDSRLAANGEAIRANFLAWFGSSRALDSKGRPAVFFHGTEAAENFQSFRVSRLATYGEGIYFSATPEAAQVYAGLGDDDTADLSNAGRIIPAYLRILNPLVCSSKDQPDIDAAVENGYDALIIQDGTETIVVVKDSRQVKSAIGNSGLYSLNSTDFVDCLPTTPRAPLPSLSNQAESRTILAATDDWPAESALVHGDGNLRVFFHGTRERFSRFSPSPSGLFGAGIYLTSSFEDAREYCDEDTQVMHVEVLLKRPFYAEADYDAGEVIDIDSPAVGFLRELFGDEANEMIERMANHPHGHLESEVADQLRKLGHDGAVIRWRDGMEHLLVLDPESIRIVPAPTRRANRARRPGRP